MFKSFSYLGCWEAARLSHLIPLGDPLGWADMGDLGSEVLAGFGVLALLLTDGQAAEIILKTKSVVTLKLAKITTNQLTA